MSQPAPTSGSLPSFLSRRPVQDDIPPTRGQRDELHRVVERYVANSRPVPPLTYEELTLHTGNVLQLAKLDAKYTSYAAVVVSNEVWKPALAAVPNERRLLLLPQCLRDRQRCRGHIDEYGLLCDHCGHCALDGLTKEAERLGYAVLVAEGMTVVIEMIRSGRIHAVVGVSCLESLEKVYPLIEAAAVPAVAMPLLQDGCADTSVDLDRVWDAIHLASPRARGLDVDALHTQAESWFTSDAMRETLGPAGDLTEEIARQWLALAGKRWRPMLTACAYSSLSGTPADSLPPEVRSLGLAVECFHKASLVHDDIEDADRHRYGRQTLHEQHGLSVALNVGDFLLGEGYRLIGECPVDDRLRSELLRTAARGHRDLCLGQGRELCWLRDPRPLSPQQVVDIFRLKTAPAFAVALRFGALCAGAGRELCEAMDLYSEHLGIAYQVYDDLADLHDPSRCDDPARPQPSILCSLAHEASDGRTREALASAWCCCPQRPGQARTLHRMLLDLGAEAAARELLAHHVRQAAEALRAVRSAALKRLLRQVLGRVFCDVQAGELRQMIGAEGLPGARGGG
ncbi:MAG TPA: polyprenyl synthetase family protein [Phycisphaerae bacterium]|nr:polyprenyl synthetase family protein [Phycisphaerae bacterium]